MALLANISKYLMSSSNITYNSREKKRMSLLQLFYESDNFDWKPDKNIWSL